MILHPAEVEKEGLEEPAGQGGQVSVRRRIGTLLGVLDGHGDQAAFRIELYEGVFVEVTAIDASVSFLNRRSKKARRRSIPSEAHHPS
jgi:hypothetical protein